jgi:serine/threonine protein kinase
MCVCILRASWIGIPCVVKKLPTNFMKIQLEDQLNEIGFLSLLRHPHIISLLGVITHDDPTSKECECGLLAGSTVVESSLSFTPPQMVIELMSGGTLEEILIQRAPKNKLTSDAFSRVYRTIVWKPLILKWALHLASAMAYLHHGLRHPVIHRDLKPANILLSSRDLKTATIKICDLGFARQLPTSVSSYENTDFYSMSGCTGSYRFMAPEVFKNQPYGLAADVYSMGSIFYWMFSGLKPHSTLTPENAVEKSCSGSPPSLTRFMLKGDKLRELILSMMHYDPRQRPSFIQVIHELENIIKTSVLWTKN